MGGCEGGREGWEVVKEEGGVGGCEGGGREGWEVVKEEGGWEVVREGGRGGRE